MRQTPLGPLSPVASVTAVADIAAREDDVDPPLHAASDTLLSRLNAEWRELSATPQSLTRLGQWRLTQPALCGYADLEQLRTAISTEPQVRDRVLLALLSLAQEGEQLAGRVVLQAMLPKAVALAGPLVRRPDVLGDRQEAQAVAVAALWQAITTYRLAARPVRVAANLSLDTLALVQRGHTGSSYFTRTFPEQSYADLTDMVRGWHYDVGPDDPAGPPDAELLVLLAWAVRTGVLQLDQARLLARVYGVDGQPPAAGTQLAAELGISWPALRQRCHRLARRLGAAAVAAGVPATGHDTRPLLTAA